MWEMGNAYKILLTNLKGTGHKEHPGIHGRIILKYILRKQGGRM
jgi:hypothetical protein